MTSEQKISDEAVRATTGKGWAEWLRILDEWGAAEKGHKATAKHLHAELGVGSWWAQTITVRHEVERGLRVVGQRGGTFEVAVSRTIGTTPARAFDAFTEAAELSTWFTTKAEVDLCVGGRYRNADRDEGEFLRIDPPKRLRFTWENAEHCPGTVVEVDLTPKGDDRAQVRITHKKLAREEDREEMRTGWKWALDSLKSYLETGKPVTFEDWEKARDTREEAR